MDAPDDRTAAITTLRVAGLRVTSTRLAVLDALQDCQHATAEALEHHVRGSVGTVSKQAVYNVLAAFTQAGLVRQIEPAGSPVRYETRTGDNHHHLVCRSCGTVADLDCQVDEAPCLTPTDDLGFEIDEAEIVFWGYCPSCQTTRKTKETS
ncbi:MAG: transcriptional repressor [Actinomycetota bacterium]|nr:transcriptional repressor [Actinomycetota bacterium]